MKLRSILLCTCCFLAINTYAQTERETDRWDLKMLEQRAMDHMDHSKRDTALYQQDINTYAQYKEVFNQYPINKSPFPVAEYDYAVISTPIERNYGDKWYYGVNVGEYLNPESDDTSSDLLLLFVTEEKGVESTTLVESRNYPYLSAEGSFKTKNDRYDWTFVHSPDGFSFLIVNMKVFDLRFGKSIFLKPNDDGSFEYAQLVDTPNLHEDADQIEKLLMRIKKDAIPVASPY